MENVSLSSSGFRPTTPLSQDKVRTNASLLRAFPANDRRAVLYAENETLHQPKGLAWVASYAKKRDLATLQTTIQSTIDTILFPHEEQLRYWESPMMQEHFAEEGQDKKLALEQTIEKVAAGLQEADDMLTGIQNLYDSLKWQYSSYKPNTPQAQALRALHETLTTSIAKIAVDHKRIEDLRTTLALSPRIAKMQMSINTFIQKEFHAIDYETFEEIERTYTEAEMLLNEPNLPEHPRQELINIISQIRNFKDAFQLLNELNELETFLRTATPDEIESQHGKLAILKRFETFIGQYQTDIEELAIDYRNEQNKWNQIKRNIFQVAREYASVPLNMRNITWITGNRSAAIIGMEAAAKAGLSQTPSLIPTGRLLEHNIVPLTGYLGMNISSESGINREHLSGTSLRGLETCMSYATRDRCMFDPWQEIHYILKFNDDYFNLNRLKVAVLRLILMNQNPYPECWNELKKHIRDIILAQTPPHIVLETEKDWTSLIGLIGVSAINIPVEESTQPLKKGQLVVDTFLQLRIGMVAGQDRDGVYVIFAQDGSILYMPTQRIKAISKSAAQDLTNRSVLQDDKVLNAMKKSMTAYEQVDNIIKLFDTVETLELSEESLSLVQNSFPIIWASCTLTSEYYEGEQGERLVKGMAELGSTKDMQLAFTDAEHVERLKKALKKYDVHVLSFDIAKYMLSLSTSKGGNAYL